MATEAKTTKYETQAVLHQKCYPIHSLQCFDSSTCKVASCVSSILRVFLVDVNKPVKYSVYQPIVGEVCWDAAGMKCYFLPLSPLLALFPLLCHWSGTVVSAALLIATWCIYTHTHTHWPSKGLDLPLITHFHFLFLDEPATTPTWVDTNDGKQHSRTGEEQEGGLHQDIIANKEVEERGRLKNHTLWRHPNRQGGENRSSKMSWGHKATFWFNTSLSL